MTEAVSQQTFQRTGFTYTAYASQVFFGLMMALPGAAMPFVSERLGLSYGLTGWHFSLSAAGALLVGLIGERMTAGIGNRRATQISMALAALAAFGLVFGGSLWITLPATLVMGAGTGGVATFITAALVDAYPVKQAKVLAEGNIVAGIGVALAPMLAGLLARAGVGWQSIAGVILLAAMVLLTLLNRASFPDSAEVAENNATPAAKAKPTAPLPPLFWLFATILFLSVSIEWLLFYWSPDFLETIVGFEQATAAALISVQAVAIVIGRLVGRRLLDFVNPNQLLLGAFMLITAMLPVYLLSPFAWLNVVALFVLGLGIGNLFPLGLTGAMSAGGAQTARASARVSVVGSAAMLIMPNVIGNLADYVGIRPALWSVAIIAMIAIGVLFVAQQRKKHRQQTRSLAHTDT